MRMVFTPEMRKWADMVEPYIINVPGEYNYLDPNAPDYIKEADNKINQEYRRIRKEQEQWLYGE